MLYSILADVVGGIGGPISKEIPLGTRIGVIVGSILVIIVIVAVIVFVVRKISSHKHTKEENNAKMSDLSEDEKELIRNYRENKAEIDDKDKK